MSLIVGFIILLGCQFLGELIVRAFSIPVPGPVVGMVILLVALLVNCGVPKGLRKTGEGLLNYLTLLFVPAGVGMMVHIKLIQADFWTIAVTLIVSTAITLAVTAKVMTWMNQRITGSEKAK
ncbi:CidA/LrgA family protein [Halomonas sp. YLGW01]|uniref:CidA/LrgA family protein n=1 Tax=Halomonas sp. YLGW01 TaxID=2773308 RepID=UPI00178230DA|nr:CidA/LrgA family protein [Halomonas sp. YLGW01]